MRLRKQNIKTAFNEQTEHNSRFRLLRRQNTSVEQFISQCSQSQKHIEAARPSQKILTFFSNETDCGTLADKLKRIKRLNDLVQKSSQVKKSADSQFGQLLSKVQTNKFHIQKIETNYRGAQSKTGHKRAGTQQVEFLHSSRTKKSAGSAAATFEMSQRYSYKKRCAQVDEIYNKIAMLKDMGYSELKINSWIFNFCQKRRSNLRDCLMKKMPASFVESQQPFQYQKQSHVVKKKILRTMKKQKEIQSPVDIADLSSLAIYLEEIFIEKNSLKVQQVHEGIVDKMSLEKLPHSKKQSFVFTKKQSTEVVNFMYDLTIQQSKYGSFEAFTRVNKLRFQQLSCVEKSLKDVYQVLILDEARKLVKPNAVV